MELVLWREYSRIGTNGTLFWNSKKVCHTIELPWKGNRHLISCIPEGTYRLSQRSTPAFKWHLVVHNVPQRESILIHPANNAMQELQGCIAPVCELIGEGRGLASHNALDRIRLVTSAAFASGEPVFLNIKKNENETIAKDCLPYSSFL